MTQSRKLAAIMFTDIVGFTAMSAEDEEKALALIEKQREILQPIVKNFGGNWLKETGDGLLLSFSSSRQALDCGINIQEAARDIEGLNLRIGIHQGDILERGGDVFGDDVNIAARIEPFAAPGGIAISDKVQRDISGSPEFTTRYLGRPKLKGVKQEVKVYCITSHGLAETRLAEVAAKLEKQPSYWLRYGVPLMMLVAVGLYFYTGANGVIKSIAVLPFENLSNDPEQEYFVDGMMNEMIATLSKIGALRIISRTSVMRYKNTDTPLAQIARELGVDAVVEGSVLKVGGTVRISAQLIRAKKERNLWSETYDRNLSDILALHSEVARDIANKIKATITPEEDARLAAARPVNPEAYRFYLLGLYHRNKWQPADLDIAIKYFQQAMALDPQFAQAPVALAGVYGAFAFFGFMPPKQAYEKRIALVAQALEIDSDLADAHRVLALTSFYFNWDWEKAEEEFQRAIELNPSDAQAHQFYTWFLVAMGRTEEAHTTIRRALELEPLGINAYLAASDVFYMSRQFDQAITPLREVLDLSPNQPFALFRLGSSYVQQGMFNEAIDNIEQALTLSPDNVTIISVLGHAYASAGETAKARQILNDLHGLAKKRYVPPNAIALIYTGLGENEEALEWLERAYQDRNSWLPWLRVDPQLDPLREEPRFQDLISRMNFPD